MYTFWDHVFQSWYWETELDFWAPDFRACCIVHAALHSTPPCNSSEYNNRGSTLRGCQIRFKKLIVSGSSGIEDAIDVLPTSLYRMRNRNLNSFERVCQTWQLRRIKSLKRKFLKNIAELMSFESDQYCVGNFRYAIVGGPMGPDWVAGKSSYRGGWKLRRKLL